MYGEEAYFLTVTTPTVVLALGLFLLALVLAFKAPVTLPLLTIILLAGGYFYLGGYTADSLPAETSYVLGYGLIAIVIGKMLSG